MTNPYDDLIGAEPANPYDELLTQQSRGKVRSAAVASRGRNPDAYALADNIARRNGWPTQVVADNLDQFSERERLDKLDAIDAEAPELSSWLADPSNMTFAADDLDNLRDMAISLRPNGVAQPTTGQAPRSWSELGGDLGLRFRQYAREGVLGLAEAPVNIINTINRGVNNDAARIAGLFGQTPDGNIPMLPQPGFLRDFRAATDELAGEEYEREASFKLSAQDAERPDTFLAALGYMAQNPSTLATDAAGAAGAMISGIVPGSREATIAAQATQQASMAAAEVNRLLVSRGYSEQDALAASADAFGPAAAIGLLAPRIVPGGAAFEGTIAGEASQIGGNRVRQALTSVVGEAVSEGAEEGGVQVAQNLASGDPALQGAGGAAAAGLALGAGMGGVAAISNRNPRVEREAVESVSRVFESLNDTDRLAKITELAKASKVAGRAPQAIEQLAPDETVYIPAEALRTLYQSGDPASFVADLTGDPDAYAAAGEYGDIAIPMAKWVSAVSRLPNAEEFAANARTKVDGYSRADLGSLDMDAELGALESAEEAPDTSADVQQDVLAQLLAAGTYTPADAELQANVTAKVFGTLASRTGQDAKALYDRYQLRISGPEPGLAERAVAGVKRLFQRGGFDYRAAAERQGYDTSIVYYHGTSSDFDTFARIDGGNMWGPGFYLTPSPESANGYATGEGGNRIAPQGEAGPNVMPVFLRMHNPFDMAAEAKPATIKAIEKTLGESLADYTWPGMKNRDLRQALFQQFTTQSGANRIIQEAGFDGIAENNATSGQTVMVFRPEQIKSATGNRGTFDPSDPSILNQPADGGHFPRGQIEIGDGRKMSIRLLGAANRSTFFHEMGHFFLEVLQDIAPESDQVAGDLAVIRQWVGNDGGDFTTDQHEQFARGFEAYLFEGKAPSPELVTAFARFRAWLLDVYRNLKALNVTLTDDVRGVFDRLIATEEEIEAAQVKQGMVPMVTAEQGRELGLSEAQWEAYVAALEAGTEEARQEVAQRLLKAHQRQQEAAYKEERAKVREEVEAETEVAPAVRAWRILAGAAKVNGEEVPAELRELHLDPEAILPNDREAIKGMGVTRKVGGVSPDTAAMLLGFPSGDALMQALAGVRGLQDQIDMEVDRRMEARYPDPIRNLPADAMRAVHNNKRVLAMEAELDLIAQVSGQPRPNRRQLRAIAEARIKALKIRELRPASHLTAERKAARVAMQAAAKGDFAEALKAKREQMLHGALYSEALKARASVERQVRYARRFDKASTRQRIGKAGNDLLEMIDEVLGAYSFRPVSDKARERSTTLRKWYDRMVEQGVEPNVPEAVLQQIEQSRLTHYRELTVAELDGVVEVVRQLEHQAREANTIRLGEIESDLEQAETDLSVAIRAGLKDRGPPPISETLVKRFPHKAGKAWRLAGAWLLRLRTLAQWVDGEGNVDGAFHSLIVRPLDRAQAAYRDAMLDYGQRVSDLFDTYLKDKDISGDIWIATLRQNLTKSDILAVALNTGNASNLQRLKDGRRWGDVQMTEILSHMTKGDWDFVQATWDTLESLWPQIAAQQKHLTGVEPPKIEPQSVVTPFGTYAGGYYPVVYDRDSSEYKSIAGDGDDSFFDPVALSALPANGHTKSRVQKAQIPIKLDLGVIPQHLSSILKDLTHRETLLGIRKLTRQPAVTSALRETLGPEFVDMIDTKLRQVATDQVVQGGRLWNAAGKISRGVRRHVGIMAQGFAVTSGLKQIIGLSNSMEVLTARHGRRAAALLAEGTRNAFKPGAVEAVMAMSGEMRHRLNTADTDIRLNMNRYLSGKMDGSLKGKLTTLHDGAVAHAYIMIQYVQTYAVDIPLWIAAHEGALRNGLTGDAAIAAADDAVITAQGAGGAKDTALIEGQIPFLEWLTMFYSYASAYLNRQVSMGRQLAKAREGGIGAVAAELPLLSARVMLLVALPVVMEELINQMSGASDGPGDEDEDGDQDVADQALYYGERMGAYAFYGVPGLRDIVGAKYGYRLSPVQSVPESYMRLTKDVQRELAGEDVEARKIVRDAVNVAGYTLGLPLAGPYKHIDYLWRVLEGEEQPESIPEFAAAVAIARREQR